MNGMVTGEDESFCIWCEPCTVTRGKRTREMLEVGCREPARGIPLVAKVMREEAWHTQRRDRASGVPLDILEHLPPQKNQSAYFIAVCSHL